MERIFDLFFLLKTQHALITSCFSWQILREKLCQKIIRHLDIHTFLYPSPPENLMCSRNLLKKVAPGKKEQIFYKNSLPTASDFKCSNSPPFSILHNEKCQQIVRNSASGRMKQLSVASLFEGTREVDYSKCLVVFHCIFFQKKKKRGCTLFECFLID